MKTFLLCFCALLAARLPLSAAQPDFDSVGFGGGTKNDKTRGVTFDRAGNAILVGEVTGDSAFGDQAVRSAGGMDFAVAKLDANGRFLWARIIGGSLTDRGYGVAADASGHVYVTGHFQSTDAIVNGNPLPNHGDYDVFVAKYDPAGKLLWIRTAGGKGYDYGHGIAVDSVGDIVVTGAVAGESKFGDVVLRGEARPIFCAKYTADGELKWVVGSSGKASGSGHGIGVDAANHIYFAGNISGEGAFGGVPLTPAKGQNTLLLKLDPAGKALWARTTAGGGIHEIAVDAEGRTWLAGMFKGEAAAGDARYQTTGPADADGLLIHYNAQGDLQWSRVLQGPKTDYCLGVATDGKGTAFVTGEFSETASFAGKSLTSKGATDIFVAGIQSSGALLWMIQAGGPKGDNAYTMAFHGPDQLVLGGAFTGPAHFGGKELPATQAADLYGARLRLR